MWSLFELVELQVSRTHRTERRTPVVGGGASFPSFINTGLITLPSLSFLPKQYPAERRLPCRRSGRTDGTLKERKKVRCLNPGEWMWSQKKLWLTWERRSLKCYWLKSIQTDNGFALPLAKLGDHHLRVGFCRAFFRGLHWAFPYSQSFIIIYVGLAPGVSDL